MPTPSVPYRTPLRRYATLAAALWTLVLLLSVVWNLHKQNMGVRAIAEDEARTIVDMDNSFRRWIIGQGGVYVPVTPETSAEPAMRGSEKDVRTPSGRRLTRVSHAYVMRQIYAERARKGLPYGGVSSLEGGSSDVPGPWKRAALESFQRGETESVSVVGGGRGAQVSYMRAFRSEAECLSCHAPDGHRLGEVRGGIYSTVSLSPLLKAERGLHFSLIVWHLFIWGLGLGGIALSAMGLDRAMTRLWASEERFRCLFETSRDALMTLAPPSWSFTSGNPATVAMFGAKDEADFTARGPWELSPERQPDGRPSSDKAREMIETAMRTGVNFFEWTHRRFDGQDFPAEVLLTRTEADGKTFLQATVRDITERKNAEAERLVTIQTLQDALAQVKLLKGFIPICAACKKIRGDKGFWESVETYISQHSEARFSHGICPDCGKKLYGDLYGREFPEDKGADGK